MIRDLDDVQFAQRYGCDRFTATVLANRFDYVVEHMCSRLLTAAFSPILRDFYDFAAKYTDGMTEHVCPADLPAGTALVPSSAVRTIYPPTIQGMTRVVSCCKSGVMEAPRSHPSAKPVTSQLIRNGSLWTDRAKTATTSGLRMRPASSAATNPCAMHWRG